MPHGLYLIVIKPELPHTSRRNIIADASLYLPPPLRERGGQGSQTETQITREESSSHLYYLLSHSATHRVVNKRFNVTASLQPEIIDDILDVLCQIWEPEIGERISCDSPFTTVHWKTEGWLEGKEKAWAEGRGEGRPQTEGCLEDREMCERISCDSPFTNATGILCV